MVALSYSFPEEERGRDVRVGRRQRRTVVPEILDRFFHCAEHVQFSFPSPLSVVYRTTVETARTSRRCRWLCFMALVGLHTRSPVLLFFLVQHR